MKAGRFARLISVSILLLWSTAGAQTVLTLDGALKIAMDNSPDIKSLQYNIERSRQMLAAQKAALKSHFSLSITPIAYNQDRAFNDFFSTWNTNQKTQSYGTLTISQPILWTDGTLSVINRFGWQDSYSEYQDVRDRSFSNNLYLSIQQPIFTYNRTKLSLRNLELDLENTALTFAIQKLALEKNVTQAFYNVYQNDLSLNVAQEEYENQKESYQIIKNKVEAGISAEEELYQAELNLATSESNMYNQQVQLENAKDQFKILVGISLYDDIKVTADISHEPVSIDLTKAIEHGLKYRMELRQRQINITTSQFDLIQTQAQNEFKGNINLSYGIFGTDERFRDLYQVPTKNQNFSLSFSVPLFDWGEKKARIKASEATINQRELSLDTEKNDIIFSIRQVYRNLQNLNNQVDIARQNERNAQLTYDINLERYKNGDLTSMDLSLFQNQLSQKKNSLVSALINYKMELLNIKIQALYDFQKDQSVVPELEY